MHATGRYDRRVHTLRTELDGRVASLVIDRPETKNALDQDMWERLPVLLDECARAPVGVLLVRSATDGMFSSGADIREYRENAGDPEWGMDSQTRVQAALTALREFPAPTAAVIDGPCVGGGAGLALACDFRLCSERSSFGIPPAKLGLVFPYSDLAALVGLVGPNHAKRILFTGQVFSAEWAGTIGFVDEVHPADNLAAAVDALVQQLLATAPGSVRAMKRLIAMVERHDPDAPAVAARLASEALAGPEHREGVTAFLERRPPDFTAPSATHPAPPPPA